jgi:hypothetical protein
MKWEDIFSMSRLWKPLIHSLKERREQGFSNNIMVMPS